MELQKLLSNAINSGYKKILIEMMEVDYIDSTFLGLLVVYLKKSIKNRWRSLFGRLKIICLFDNSKY
jgi:anti-anti-sigma regulatory factor